MDLGLRNRIRMGEYATALRPIGNVVPRADMNRHGRKVPIFFVKQNERPMWATLEGGGAGRRVAVAGDGTPTEHHVDLDECILVRGSVEFEGDG